MSQTLMSRWKTTIAISVLAICSAGNGLAQQPTATALPPGASATPQAVELSMKETKKLIAKKVRAEYPPLARSAQITGRCRVQIVLDQEGNLIHTKLLSGHPIIVPACLNAVREWKFRPLVVQGQAVEARGEVELDIGP